MSPAGGRDVSIAWVGGANANVSPPDCLQSTTKGVSEKDCAYRVALWHISTAFRRELPRAILATVEVPVVYVVHTVILLPVPCRVRDSISIKTPTVPNHVAHLGNGRFPRILSSATYPASVERQRPMSAGRLNAATLLRDAS
jgi:hypothetical protein